MNTSSDARHDRGPTATNREWLRSFAMIVIFDIAAPLVAYKWLRSAGLTAVNALLLSGVFPAIGVAIGAIRHRRVDVVGALVLAGILVGTVLGLVSHSARLLLVEGSVPTAVFGAACLGSLWWAQRPLIYSFFLELIGPDTARGRNMILFWEHPGFRRDVRVVTAVWGSAFLIEAALRVFIVYNTSTGTALAISKVTPFAFMGTLSVWTIAYSAYRKKRFERMAPAGELPKAVGTSKSSS
jgi:intracellular septation protein A